MNTYLVRIHPDRADEEGRYLVGLFFANTIGELPVLIDEGLDPSNCQVLHIKEPGGLFFQFPWELERYNEEGENPGGELHMDDSTASTEALHERLAALSKGEEDKWQDLI